MLRIMFFYLLRVAQKKTKGITAKSGVIHILKKNQNRSQAVSASADFSRLSHSNKYLENNRAYLQLIKN